MMTFARSDAELTVFLAARPIAWLAVAPIRFDVWGRPRRLLPRQRQRMTIGTEPVPPTGVQPLGSFSILGSLPSMMLSASSFQTRAAKHSLKAADGA